MTKLLISSYNGLQEYQHIDPMKPGDLMIETVQDCSTIIENVKRERDKPVGKEWRHVAEIPLAFYDQAVKEGWLHDKQRWRNWMDNPDHAAFRVWTGRMGKRSKHI